jgi:hypothetical protein
MGLAMTEEARSAQYELHRSVLLAVVLIKHDKFKCSCEEHFTGGTPSHVDMGERWYGARAYFICEITRTSSHAPLSYLKYWIDTLG